jgi:hypothetical protein
MCQLARAGDVRPAVTVENYVPFNKVEVIVNGKVAPHDDATSESAGPRVRQPDVGLPIERSRWITPLVRGPGSSVVFDGPVRAHTSPVYVRIVGRPITSLQDAADLVDWIEQMLRVVDARNRSARIEDRRGVESLFRRARDEFRKLADAG